MPSSSKILASDDGLGNASLEVVSTLEANQTIDVRWKTASEKIAIGNRTFTLIKVQ